MNHSNQLEARTPQQMNSHSTTMKPIFKRSVTWRYLTPSDITSISKHHLKVLKHIPIKSLCAEKVGTHGIRKLRKAFVSSKKLSSVSFQGISLNGNQLTHLLDSTTHWQDLYLSPLGKTEIPDQELIKALSRLGRCKKLTSFPFPHLSTEQLINREIGSHAYQQLKGLKNLESLNLSLPFYNNTSIFRFRLSSSLIHLGLDFKSKILVPQQQLSSFVTGIQQRCNLLEHLSLSFSQEYQIEPSDAQIWASFFQNTPRVLKALHITLNFSADQQPEGIHAFIGSLKHLKQLTYLTLSTYSPLLFNQPLPFLDDLFPSVFNSLQSLTQLESLRLMCSSAFSHIDKKDVQHFSSMLQCLKNLKDLDIALPPLQFPDKCLVLIAGSLKQLNRLKTLNLRLFDNFTYESMQILFKNITHLDLTRFNLHVYPPASSPIPVTKTITQSLAKIVTFWKSNDLTPFFSDLGKLTRLSNLSLRLSSFEISNQEWKHLSRALQKLPQLSSLCLSLPQFDSATNFKDLQRLLSCLKDLPRLTTLDLRFEGRRITDQEVEILSSNLADCQSLTTLNLEFPKATQLKDESLYFLWSGVRGLLKLKDVTLLFERAEAFGEKAVSDLLEGLVVLKDLSSFVFVYDIMEMFRNNKTSLPSNLEGYENLKYLVEFIVGNSRYI